MPAFIKTRYQQYKADNRDLATWLGRTAIHFGYPSDHFSLSTSAVDAEPRTAQQVRNAKKNAKKKAKARVEEESLDPALSGTFVLKTSQYVELAEFLVRKEVVIPIEIIRLLRRCIFNRERCAERYIKNSSAPDGHTFFISQLKQVESLLTLHRGPLSERASNAPVSDNRYGALPVENIEDVPDISLPEPPRPASARSTAGARFTPEMSVEGIAVDFLMFYEDIHLVRDYIRGLWEDYKAGSADLLTVSATTNTALELLRQSSEDIMLRSEPFFDNLGHILVTLVVILLGGDPARSAAAARLFKDVPVDDQDLCAVFDHLLLPNVQILQGLAAVIANGSIPVYKPGYYGTYDPKLTFGKLRFHDRWQQGQILLCETFMDYTMLLMIGDEKQLKGSLPVLENGLSNNYFVFDETGAEMERFIATSECSLFLAIVSQVFIDINFVLGDEASRGMRDLRRGAKQMLDSIERWKPVRQSTPSGIPSPDKDLERFKEEAGHWRSEDPVDMMRTHGIGDTFPKHESNFLQRTPLLCGLILFRLQLNYQRIGFFIANSSGVIQSTAHLYNACRQFADHVSPPLPNWPDMDLFVQIHGTELFGGEIPKTIDDAYLAYLEMAGAPIDAMRAARPPHLLNRSSGKDFRMPKLLNDHTQIQPIFLDKYVYNPKSRTVVDANTISALLVDLAKSAGKLRKTRSHKAAKFSIIQLMAVLEAGLGRETASLRFDYFSMHLRCFNLLRNVHLQSKDYLASKGHVLRGDQDLAVIVGNILHVATMSSRAAAQVGIRLGRGQVGSRLLKGAADTIKEALQDPRERSVETRKVESSKRSAV